MDALELLLRDDNNYRTGGVLVSKTRHREIKSLGVFAQGAIVSILWKLMASMNSWPIFIEGQNSCCLNR